MFDVLRPACACGQEKEVVGPAPERVFHPIRSVRLGVRPGGKVRAAPSAAFGLPRVAPARARARHTGGRAATPAAAGNSTKRSPGVCGKLRSSTATKRGGRELGEKDGGSARAWIARSQDATRTIAVAQRGSRPRTVRGPRLARAGGLPGLRPLLRLPETGARHGRGHRPFILLGLCCGSSVSVRYPGDEKKFAPGTGNDSLTPAPSWSWRHQIFALKRPTDSGPCCWQ